MASKYASLLKDKRIKRWHDNLARGSPITAAVYLRRLGSFCGARGVKPHALVKLAERSVFDLMLDTVTEMEARYTGGYIE